MVALTTAQLKARMDTLRGPVVDTAHDFTAMTSAQVLAAYELSSFGSDRYVPQADGSYVLRGGGVAPVTNKGIVVDGAFTNHASNSIFAGAVVGTPGTTPAGWGTYTKESIDSIDYVRGLPALKYTSTAEATIIQGVVGPNPANYVVASCIGNIINPKGYSQFVTYSLSGGGAANTDVSGLNKYTAAYLATNTNIIYFYLRDDGPATLVMAGPQLTYGIPFAINLLALSSAANTAHTADIIQREVNLTGPFAVEIVATTAPGDPGAHQTIWCESLGANDYIHVYRATSTNQITLKVRANSTDYSVSCGTVANSTQFTLRLGVLFNKVIWSRNQSTAAELTIKRSASYVMESLGTFYDGTLPQWGSVQSVRVAAGKIPTTTEIEEGWA